MEKENKKQTSEYFLEAGKNFLRVFVNLGKGIFFAVKNNIPWAIILALFVVYHIVTLMQTRAERDAYNKHSIELEQKLDSLQPKNISYLPFK